MLAADDIVCVDLGAGGQAVQVKALVERASERTPGA